MKGVYLLLVVAVMLAGTIVPVEHFEHERYFPKIEDIVSPPFLEYLGHEPILMGTTYYDIQHNSSVGRNIAIDEYGGAHVSFMCSPTSSLSSRMIYYNYCGPTGERIAGYEDTGFRADFALHRSGYTTIDVSECTPYIAFHQANLSSDDYHSQVVWDTATIESDCAERGEFSEAGLTPPAAAYPGCSGYEPDIHTIWPVISISEFDGDVHLVSTSNLNDSLYCDSTRISPENFIVYHHAVPRLDDMLALEFDTDAVPLGSPTEISADIATARSRDEVAIAIVESGDYLDSEVDANNIVLYRSTDDGFSWDTTYVTDYGSSHHHDPYDTFFYYRLNCCDPVCRYVLDTMIVFTRPTGNLSILYDRLDNLHIIWTEAVFDTLSDLTTLWVTGYSTLKHWTSATGLISNAIDAYPMADNDRIRNEFLEGFSASEYYSNNFKPTISVGSENTLYALWHRIGAELIWCHAIDSLDSFSRDFSADGFSNLELMGSYSTDNGATWIGPAPISNTYTPECEPGDCKSEYEATLSEEADEYVHISFLLDTDAGVAIHDLGSFTESKYMYVRIPTEDFEAACYAFDDFHYVCEEMYPDSTFGHEFVNPFESVTEKNPTAPTQLALHPNYPNPFNSTTALAMEIPESGDYIVEIYDMAGRLVDVPLNQTLNRGKYVLNWSVPRGHASGSYFVRLRNAEGFYSVRRISYIK